ncbi:C25 family cysteine peptidase [Pseudomonadota bacterium]
MNWIGHGSAIGLARENVLVNDDVLVMNNGTQLPLFAALTCGAGRFALPGRQSLSEALVLREGGGAIAAYSPSGLSINADAVRLNEGLLRSLYLDGQPRIGDAALDAQWFYKEKPHWRFMLDIYGVMGDPATILH